MIYHIAKDRYENIRSQGYRLSFIAESGPISLTGKHYSDGDNVYHMLDGDHGFCEKCDKEFDSLLANTPVELEYAKLALVT